MYTVVDYMRLFGCWLLWRSFQVARSIFHWIDLTLLSPQAEQQDTTGPEAVVSKILFRHRYDPFDHSRACDFLCKRQYVTRSEDVISSDRMLLYCLDHESATFVEMPKPIRYYSAANVPFTHLRFFTDPQRTISVPLQEFHRLADTLLNDVHTPTIILHSSARCGSTLFAKIVAHSNERILSLSEPDALSTLALLLMGSRDQDQADLILRNVLRVFLRPVKGVDAFFIKMRPCVLDIAHRIHRVAPQLVQVRITRRSAFASAWSYTKVLHGQNYHKMLYLAKNHPWLRHFITLPVPYFLPVITKAADDAGLRWTVFELMCRFSAHHQLECELHDQYFQERFYYEDLVRNPEESVDRVHRLLNIEWHRIDDFKARLMEWMNEDSQSGSPLAQAALKCKEKKLAKCLEEPEVIKRAEKFFKLIPSKDITISPLVHPIPSPNPETETIIDKTT